MGGERTKFLSKVRHMKVEDLKRELSQLKAELITQNAQHGDTSRGINQPHPKFIHNLRKNIARVNTEIQRRENGRRRTGEKVRGKLSERLKHFGVKP